MSQEHDTDNKKRARAKTRIGHVASAGMDKTVVVEFDVFTKHPIFRKYIRRRTKLYAHDEKNECREGDKVEVVSIRPMSKKKRWRVSKIIERAVKV